MINNMENKRVRNKCKSSVILGGFIIICLSVTLLRGITVTSIAEEALEGTVYAKDLGTGDYTLNADTVIDVTGLTEEKSISRIYLNNHNLTITGNSEYALRPFEITGTGNFTLNGGAIRSDYDKN